MRYLFVFALLFNHFHSRGQFHDSPALRKDVDSLEKRLLMCNYVADPSTAYSADLDYENGLLCASFYFRREPNGGNWTVSGEIDDSVAMRRYSEFIYIYNDWKAIDRVDVRFCDYEGFFYFHGWWSYNHRLPYSEVPLLNRCRIFMNVHPSGSTYKIIEDTIQFVIVIPDNLMSHYLNSIYSINFAAVAYEAVFRDVLDEFKAVQIRFMNGRGGVLRTDTYMLADIPTLYKLPAPLPKKPANEKIVL